MEKIKKVLEIKRGQPVPTESKWLGEKIKSEIAEKNTCPGSMYLYRDVVYDIFEVMVEE